MEMKEEWLMPGAVVPVDAETTAALVAEIKRLIGVVGDMALNMQPAQQHCDDCGGFDQECPLAKPAQEPVAWNKKIRDSVDSLLAQAGFHADSSVRHQLACMNFDAQPSHLAEKDWRRVIPGRRHTDQWDPARVADYNQGWNDCQKKTEVELEKLYTSPPASKPWVGLTDEEIEAAIEGWWREDLKMKYEQLARAIEAMLKEKNG